MLSPLIRTSPTGFHYLLWIWYRSTKPKTPHGKVLSHTGGWPGYAALLEQVDNDETIIVLSNNETSNGNIRRHDLTTMVRDLVMPYEHKSYSSDPKLVDRYAGENMLLSSYHGVYQQRW